MRVGMLWAINQILAGGSDTGPGTIILQYIASFAQCSNYIGQSMQLQYILQYLLMLAIPIAIPTSDSNTNCNTSSDSSTNCNTY